MSERTITVARALVTEGGTILTPRVDHDAFARCMETRGYGISSR